MKKIAIFGTHGSAKTSLVYKLAAYFKMQNRNVKVIHETARHCPFPINKDAIHKTTLHLVASQLTKELEAEAEGFEISVSDRTLSDAFVYINYLGRDNILTHSLESFCLQWIKQYDILVYLEPTEGYTIGDDGIRAVDAEYQHAIRDDFRDLVQQLEERYGKELTIIKAESNEIFNEDQCNSLMNAINKALYSC
ncbi:MAG: AAA family ATPase [Chlamydiota bacterium]